MGALRTQRMELRPVHEDDIEELHALFTDADVRRYLLDDDIVSREWVAEEVEASHSRFEGSGCGLWAVREIGADLIIGFVGYRPFFEPPELQILYGFTADHWHRGLATEAAAEVLRHGFEELGLIEVRAATDAPNTASMRVLERLGLQESDRSEQGPDGTVFFEIGVDSWREANGKPSGPSVDL